METVQLNSVENVISQLGAIIRQGGEVIGIGPFSATLRLHGATEPTFFSYTATHQQGIQTIKANYGIGINTYYADDGSVQPIPNQEDYFDYGKGLKEAIMYSSGYLPFSELTRSGRIFVSYFVSGEPLPPVENRPLPTYGTTPVITSSEMEKYRLELYVSRFGLGMIPDWIKNKLKNLAANKGWEIHEIRQEHDKVVIEVTKTGSIVIGALIALAIGVLALIGYFVNRWSAVRLSDNVVEQTKEVTNAKQESADYILGLDIPLEEKLTLLKALADLYEIDVPNDKGTSWFTKDTAMAVAAFALLAVVVTRK